MRLLRCIVPIVLMVLTGVAAAQERSHTSCSASRLPVGVRNALNSQFGGWRIKTVDDLESYDQQLWIKSRRQTCPGITSGHFFTMSSRAFATLLVPEKPDHKGYEVIVFDGPDIGPVKPMIVDDQQNPGGADPVIYRLPPGSYSDAGGARRIQIQLDAIQVEKMEVSTTIYFRRDHHFEHLITSD